MIKKKIKFMKPVENNGTPNSDSQFNIKYDTQQEKKVRPKQVFEYTGAKATAEREGNIKNRLRSHKKPKKSHL